MKRMLGLLVGLSLFLTLPVHAVRKDTKIILDELEKLTKKINGIEQVLSTVSSEFSSITKKITLIEEKVSAITQSQADFNQSKENLLLSLQFIKEEINELKNSIGKINDRLVSMPLASFSLPAETGGEQGQNSTSQSPETIYYTAYSDYIKKNYQYAIDGFRQFLQLYPSNGLADNSLYWIGECYYAQKMYQEAVNTFTQLINTYNDGDKIPDATLKKGFALIEMGKQAEGIAVLKELTSKFPLSEEASLAQQKIKEVME